MILISLAPVRYGNFSSLFYYFFSTCYSGGQEFWVLLTFLKNVFFEQVELDKSKMEKQMETLKKEIAVLSEQKESSKNLVNSSKS